MLMRVLGCVMLLASLVATESMAAFTFEPGHYYTAHRLLPAITQYDSSGVNVGSIELSRGVGGLAFGPDRLLYAVIFPGIDSKVLAIDRNGVVVKTYLVEPALNVWIVRGRLAVDEKNIYITRQRDLIKIPLHGDEAPEVLFKDFIACVDVEILPNNNLLLATDREVYELTSTGSVIREFISSVSLREIQGVEFDPITNDLFVTHFGYSSSHEILRFDWSTGQLEERSSLPYAGDLFVTTSGDLLVSSRNAGSRIYSHDLDLLDEFGEQQNSVTQYGYVPEPTALTLLCLSPVGLLRRRVRLASPVF